MNVVTTAPLRVDTQYACGSIKWVTVESGDKKLTLFQPRTHWFSQLLWIKAGAKERAGFILAPVYGPWNEQCRQKLSSKRLF